VVAIPETVLQIATQAEAVARAVRAAQVRALGGAPAAGQGAAVVVGVAEAVGGSYGTRFISYLSFDCCARLPICGAMVHHEMANVVA
jgi:hypothetical protein